MKRAFTLLELLVVVAIMGLLGTASVGGYRQMQRGMEERGVRDNVDQFFRNAYQRAQIDRIPTEVYCWNETIRERSEDENEIVVGKAIAIRRYGRVSAIASGAHGGQLLVDEFGDLEQFDEDGEYAEAADKDTYVKLYQMDGGSSMSYSLVRSSPCTSSKDGTGGEQLDFVTHDPRRDTQDTSSNLGKLTQFGWEIKEKGSANWKVGSAYGMEFQTLELPKGYIFGPNYSRTIDNPIEGETKVVFRLTGSASVSSVVIYSLRPGSSGLPEAQKLAKVSDPTQRQK